MASFGTQEPAGARRMLWVDTVLRPQARGPRGRNLPRRAGQNRRGVGARIGRSRRQRLLVSNR